MFLKKKNWMSSEKSKKMKVNLNSWYFLGNVNSHNCLIDMSNNSGGNISPAALSGGSPGKRFSKNKKTVTLKNSRLASLKTKHYLATCKSTGETLLFNLLFDGLKILEWTNLSLRDCHLWVEIVYDRTSKTNYIIVKP